MADNAEVNSGTGIPVATDEIGGFHYQRVKVTLGADGTAVDASAGNGAAGTGTQRVTIASDSTGTVAATQSGTWTVQPGNTANTTAWKVDASSVAVPITDNSGSITVDNGGTFAVQATIAAGATSIAKAEDVASADADVGVPALMVRKATPANTSGTDGDYEFLQGSAGRLWVDPSGVTLTVASHAVTNAGTFAVQSTVAAGATNIAKAEDVASADADVGVPAMAVRKATPANTSGTDGDYEMLQMSAGRLWVDGSGVTQTVSGTVAATQSGAWSLSANQSVNVAQINGVTATMGNGVSGTGVQRVTIASDSTGTIAATKSGTWDITNAGTFAVQATLAAGATNIAKAEDVASANADVGVPAMMVQKATPANTAGTDGDYEFLQGSAGRLWVDPSGVTLTVASHAVTNAGTFAVQIASGATAIAKAEDVASADADVGVGCLAVQKATPANTAGTDGDYEFLQMSAGRLWVNPTGLAYSSKVTLTRTADTNAYAANDVLGAATGSTAALSFTSMGPSAGRIMITGAQLEIDASAIISGETSYILYLYNVTPPGAYGDNTAWDLPSGDRASFLGAVNLGTPADLGSTLYVEVNGINKPILLSGTGLFGYLVTVGAYTPTSARVYIITLHSVAL